MDRMVGGVVVDVLAAANGVVAAFSNCNKCSQEEGLDAACTRDSA